MLKVYKYTVLVQNCSSLELPRGAKILTVQEQHGEPQIWALVNPGNPMETRNFRLAGTGHPIEEDEEVLNYIGTFQLLGGSFIGHLFELKKE